MRNEPFDPKSNLHRRQAQDGARQLAAAERSRERQTNWQPARGVDREGIGASLDELSRFEQSIARRVSPARLLGRGDGWTQLAAVDQRLDELDADVGAAQARAAQLRDEISCADEDATQALEQWLADRRRDEDRPVSLRAALQDELRATELEIEAVRRGVRHVEAERVAVVARHRGQMLRDAQRLVETRRAAAERLVDELRRARDVLVEAAGLQRWAARFPDADVAVPWATLALASKRTHVALGLPASTGIEALLNALTTDIETIATAASAGTAETVDPTAARWAADIDQTERAAERERYAQAAAQAHGVPRESLTEAQYDAFLRQVAEDQRLAS